MKAPKQGTLNKTFTLANEPNQNGIAIATADEPIQHEERMMNSGEWRYAYRRTRTMLVDKERRPCQVGGCGDKAVVKIAGLAVCHTCASRILEACGEHLMNGQRVSRQEALQAARG